MSLTDLTMAALAFSWPALVFCLSTLAVLALRSYQKYVVLEKSRLTGCAGRPTTPALEKQLLPKPLASSVSDLATFFPPRRRDQLESLLSALSPARRGMLSHISFTQEVFERSLLRLEEDYKQADTSKYVYSGVSIREIRALGSFPDYSTLSGVPMPTPYLSFDIARAKPRPYRPFRRPYHQTMSLTKLEPDWWIELHSNYKECVAQRQELHAKHGPAILQWLPGSELACKELMEMVIQFICARYPQYFVLSEDQLWLENKILGIQANLREKHPLLILLDHVPEDFAVMLRDPGTGHYIFRAGIICSAVGWNLAEKIGLKLGEIHQPVPDYEEKMKFSMDRFFSKMPSDRPIQRGSWDLVVDQPLYTSQGEQHSSYENFQSESVTSSRVNLRVDWQTLRRMPLSGGIVFNFKALFTPIEEFRSEPHVPSLLLAVSKHGEENMMKYKNMWRIEHVVVPTLERYEMEQVESALIEKTWTAQTLDESPWFPGWEEKWHMQQGF
ncbi:alpha-1,2-mannosyltransferase, partial [Xylaria palmicola]